MITTVAGGLALTAHAGVYVETQDKNAVGGRAQLIRIYIQDGAARIEHSHGGEPAPYVIFKDDQFFAIDPAKKRYTTLDRDSAKAIGGAMDSVMEQLRKELGKLKPEQRAAVEQAMGENAGAALSEPGPAPVIAARDTGRGDTVNGIACRDWEITRDGKRSEELCVAPFSSVPGKEDFPGLALRMQSLLEDLKGALSHAGGNVEDLALMEKVQGFPVRIRRYDDSDQLRREVVLKDWREETLPAATFEVPEDYARRDLKGELTGK
jgi:hypothetical protein